MKLYECGACGNLVRAEDVEEQVAGSEKPVTLRPTPFCCDTHMHLIERDDT